MPISGSHGNSTGGLTVYSTRSTPSRPTRYVYATENEFFGLTVCSASASMRTPASSSVTFQPFTATEYLFRSGVASGCMRCVSTSLGPNGRQMVKRELEMSLAVPADAEISWAVAGSNSYEADPAGPAPLFPVRTRAWDGAGRAASGAGPSQVRVRNGKSVAVTAG